MRTVIIMWFMALVIMPFHTNIQAQSSIAPKPIEVAPELSFTNYPSRWQRMYAVSCRKAGECARKSKSALKDKRYMDALAMAAEVFQHDPSRRLEKKALEMLKQNHVIAAQKEYEQEVKKYPDSAYANYRSAKNLYNRMWQIQKYNYVMSMLKQLDHPKVKLDVKLLDADMVGKLATKLSSFRMRAAEEYYAGGEYFLALGNKSGDKSDYKKSAMSFLIADQYVKDFKDAKQQYEAAKKLATSTVYISSHYAYSGSSFARTLKDDIKTDLHKLGLSRLRFVEITESKNADYHIVLKASGLELTAIGKSSDKQEYTKKVKGDDGKEITKTATVITFSSGFDARSVVHISVVEKRTQKNIYSSTVEETYSWRTVWSKISGDESIVRPRDKRHVGKAPDKPLSRKTFYERSIALCAPTASNRLYRNVLSKLGASPTHSNTTSP
ncbi:hypothetical protein [Seonamhaeicola marinus]|uniref:Tetratricopeptide repeat protein n=1 Tax=Seonamhaeicola marinus TaxID=1912246 RepID=A0A5D0HVI3_9FLAO|nr:hypothetical protein [Seonamhaeicola marinus]TYA74941.1 hypothetical protein FUA24_16715 [Seonamhaeicola marinus]